jgi:hypothetical protein
MTHDTRSGLGEAALQTALLAVYGGLRLTAAALSVAMTLTRLP